MKKRLLEGAVSVKRGSIQTVWLEHFSSVLIKNTVQNGVLRGSRFCVLDGVPLHGSLCGVSVQSKTVPEAVNVPFSVPSGWATGGFSIAPFLASLVSNKPPTRSV